MFEKRGVFEKKTPKLTLKVCGAPSAGGLNLLARIWLYLHFLARIQNAACLF
jgi:hypothetical protein